MKIYAKALADYGDDDTLLSQTAAVMKHGTPRGLGRPDEARRAYSRMKDQIRALNETAQCYREERKFDQAVPIYQDLISKDAAKATQHQFQLGYTYQQAGKYKEAISSYQQCDNFPSNLQQIAECYQQMKQYKEAIGIYTQIVGGYESRAPWALQQIAYMQEYDGKSEAAIKTFQQVCKRYPKTSEASQAHQHLNNKYKITVTLGGAKDE